jgi:hypothetical protein
LLLPLLSENPVGRLKCVAHAIDERVGRLPGWDDLGRSIASSQILEQFALQLWQHRSFTYIVEGMLMQQSVTPSEGVLGIVDAVSVTVENFPVFLKFISDFLTAGAVKGVDKLCQKLLIEAAEFDYSSVELDLDTLFDFLSANGYIRSLLRLIVLICARNTEFNEILQDEISTLSTRRNECPHIVMLNMFLNAKSLDDTFQIYRNACKVVPDCDITSRFL